MATRKKNLQLLLSLIQKRCLQTSSSSADALLPPTRTTNASSSTSFDVHFLMNSCGLSSKSALSVSHKLHLHQNKLQNPQSVLLYLKSHEFDDTHIAQLIEKRPQILHSGVDDTLKPKFDFLVQNGFTGKLLPQLIASDPNILSAAVDSRLKPCFELLKSFLGSPDRIVVALKRAPFLMSFSFKGAVQPNIELLIKEGMAVDRVAKLLSLHARVILVKHDRMVYAVNALKNLGVEPKTPVFLHAVKVMLSVSKSNWRKKIEFIKSIGWSEEEIIVAFKRYPYLLACSEEKIRKSLDFFVNTLKLEPRAIITCPEYLSYSVDRRLRPRHNVLKVLLSKKLVKDEKIVQAVTRISDKDFLENYVTKYADKVTGLLEIYGDTSKAKKMDS
uniref:Uncharacterized protein n=1 Tax=Salix viminalis TaxID=40686 RepID=A0A6N2M6P7_SALVM